MTAVMQFRAAFASIRVIAAKRPADSRISGGGGLTSLSSQIFGVAPDLVFRTFMRTYEELWGPARTKKCENPGRTEKVKHETTETTDRAAANSASCVCSCSKNAVSPIRIRGHWRHS